jgi:rod shape-determining protein MreB
VSFDTDRVRSALLPALNQIITAIRDLLERTPPELSADIAKRGLTLVGGGALIRGLDALIERETGLHVAIDDDPLTTVARGPAKRLNDSRRRHPGGRAAVT